ncbi:MAG: hypothetical protein JJD95_13695 [Clostridium sp.]|nr:hypothetical protein [Clostridium sp.]
MKELEINGNSEALLIALENIIENQLRYAKSYISILITANDKMVVEISNDGPCFEAKDPMELFDSYKRVAPKL